MISLVRISDESVVLRLMILFRNIRKSSIYPDQLKLDIFVPVHKKEDKQLAKKYRLKDLLMISGKWKKSILAVLLHAQWLVIRSAKTNLVLFLLTYAESIPCFLSIEYTKPLRIQSPFRSQSCLAWYIKGFRLRVSEDRLRQNGLKFSRSFLSNRKRRVMINSFYSKFPEIESGLPKGIYSWSSSVSCL